MRELKGTFDLLYDRKRMLAKDLESVNSSLQALQSKCEHEYDEDPLELFLSITDACSICGKRSSGSVVTIK